jgi:zinc finger protein 830
MSDVRALLKAKRQEARVIHPFAVYSAVGQLRCTACNTLVKHASAWQGHLGSKIHRSNVTILKEQQRESVEERGGTPEGSSGSNSGDEEEEEPQTTTSVVVHDSVAQDRPPTFNEGITPTSIDLEWKEFQRSVVNTPDTQDVYQRATVVVEPEMASSVPEGFPTQNEPQTKSTVNAEEKARRIEQEERELIMDRLIDEERAQEDADSRVIVMKQKLAALKRKRELAKLQQ